MFMQFVIGDKVVYPVHGVAEIVGIDEKNIGGVLQIFYVLNILENSMCLMVPISNAEQVGMRHVVSSSDVDKVFEILRAKEKTTDSLTWNRRYREYLERVKSGSLFEVAKVLRDLYILRASKELSFGERKMLDTVRSLFIREVGLSKGISHEEIETELRAIFHS